MSEEITHNRRRFLGAAAMTLVATQFGLFRSADAQSRKADPAGLPPIKPGTNTSFSSLKQIDAGIGHSVPQEAPQAFAQAVVDVAADID